VCTELLGVALSVDVFYRPSTVEALGKG
jgi:hypothetical protein